MSSYESQRHVVGTRTFVVVEHMTDSVMVNGISTTPASAWRTVQDAQTGEVVREFKPPPGAYGPQPYDFTANQRWLEERFLHGFAAVPPIPKIGDVDVAGWRCTMVENDPYSMNSPPITTWDRHDPQRMLRHVQRRQAGTVIREDVLNERQSMGFIQNWSGNYGYATSNTNVTYMTMADTKKIVPDRAEHFDQCRYGGRCAFCDSRIEPGDSIWWLGKDSKHSRSRIWCASHKTKPATVGSEHDEEQDDMAQRQDFTFPYTGQEIADSLERKAAALDAQQKPTVQLDRDTAAMLGYAGDGEYNDLLKEKQKQADRTNKKLADEAAALRKEAIPYAKAGSKAAFDIDLEDIEHFGLNDEDAPAPVKKVRRKRAEAEVPVVASAGGAVG